MVDKNNILLKLYYDTKLPKTYGSIQGLLQNGQKLHLPITQNDIIILLKNQKAYTLHKITKKIFLCRKITASKPGVIASCGLADMLLLSRYNNGYKYTLVFIDVISRFAHAIPLKRKDANTVHNA